VKLPAPWQVHEPLTFDHAHALCLFVHLTCHCQYASSKGLHHITIQPQTRTVTSHTQGTLSLHLYRVACKPRSSSDFVMHTASASACLLYPWVPLPGRDGPTDDATVRGGSVIIGILHTGGNEEYGAPSSDTDDRCNPSIRNQSCNSEPLTSSRHSMPSSTLASSVPCMHPGLSRRS
jgi:hypothetical protein